MGSNCRGEGRRYGDKEIQDRNMGSETQGQRNRTETQHRVGRHVEANTAHRLGGHLAWGQKKDELRGQS